jgi:hypothetical protein
LTETTLKIHVQRIKTNIDLIQRCALRRKSLQLFHRALDRLAGGGDRANVKGYILNLRARIGK